jgi:hypothetical protein
MAVAAAAVLAVVAVPAEAGRPVAGSELATGGWVWAGVREGEVAAHSLWHEDPGTGLGWQAAVGPEVQGQGGRGLSAPVTPATLVVLSVPAVLLLLAPAAVAAGHHQAAVAAACLLLVLHAH